MLSYSLSEMFINNSGEGVSIVPVNIQPHSSEGFWVDMNDYEVKYLKVMFWNNQWWDVLKTAAL